MVRPSALLVAACAPGARALAFGAPSRPASRRIGPLKLADGPAKGEGIVPARNVLGATLACCCSDVCGSGIGTGFYRDGHCSTGPQDTGSHTVCCAVTDAFLRYSKSVGNDLSTPVPQYAFPGLREGDRWCLCASRWAQALKAGVAPRVILLATHERALDHASLEQLRAHAIDGDEADRVLAELDAMRAKLERSLEGSD